MMKSFVVLCAALALSSVSVSAADKKTSDRLRELIDKDDADTILAEKDVFSAVINDPFFPVVDCEAAPLNYAIIKHSNKALAALLQVPNVKPTEQYVQADRVNRKFPRLYVLHTAAMATSIVAEDNPHIQFVTKALCAAAEFRHDAETWKVIKTIPDLDPSQQGLILQDKAVVPRFSNCTALHFAALTTDGSVAVTELLGMPGIDVTASACHDSKRNTQTPTQLATLSGNGEAVKAFLALNEAVIDGVNENGETILHTAAQMGFVKPVEAILSTARGRALVDMVDAAGYNALHVTIAQAFFHVDDEPRFVEVAKALIPHMSVEAMNAKTTDGYLNNQMKDKNIAPGKTPLAIAVIANRTQIVRLLVTEARGKVDPNIPDGGTGFTALHMAAHYNSYQVAEILLTHPKINLEAVTTGAKRTPLITACKAGSVETVKVLLDDGRVDVEAKDKSGYTGLDWATGRFYGNEAIQALFAEHEKKHGAERKVKKEAEEEKKKEEL